MYKKGQAVSDRNLVLIYCKNKNTTLPLFGFSISKKYGKAVRRNRIRRQLKSCASRLAPRVKGHYNLVFLPRTHATSDYHRLYVSMQHLLANADLLTEEAQ